MSTTLMMQAIPPYLIHIGSEVLDGLRLQKYTKVICCVDENVWALHQAYIERFLPTEFILEIPSGEQSKSLLHYEQIVDQLLAWNCDRSTVLLAVGGGVVGDLVGFVAATFMRGIDFIQIPTTILAHDSAIGGKVAINTMMAKNSIGAFHQPKSVYYDMQFLSTLEEREILSGFGEICKHMFIDEKFYQFMQAYPSLVAAIENIEAVLLRSMQVKQYFVQEDPYEFDIRKYLNFGHTFGHALEQMSEYDLPHGLAVAHGMVFAEMIGSQCLGIAETLKQYGLLEPLAGTFDFESLYACMQKDKKNKADQIQFVLLEAIGKPYMQPVSKLELQAQFNIWAKEYLV